MAATDFRRIANTFVYLRLRCLEHRGSQTSGLDLLNLVFWTLGNGLANLYGGVFHVFPAFCFVSVEAFRSEPPAKAYHANKRILEDRF